MRLRGSQGGAGQRGAGPGCVQEGQGVQGCKSKLGLGQGVRRQLTGLVQQGWPGQSDPVGVGAGGCARV